MGIDPLKPKASPTVTKNVESKPVEAPKVQPVVASVTKKLEEGFDALKKKLVSISGRYASPPAEKSNRRDLNDLVASQRLVAQVNGAETPAPVNRDRLEAAIASDSDSKIREAIIDDPGQLKGMSAEQKGKALERLRSGVVSPGDKHAMSIIVRSCESKEELREVIKSATGKQAVGQEDFHSYDKHLTDKHPCLVADLLNPDNPSLPATAAAAKSSAAAKDPDAVRAKVAENNKAADGLIKAGKYDEARKLINENKAAEKELGAGARVDPWKGMPSVDSDPSRPGRETKFKGPGDREETFTSASDRKLAQIDQAENMSKTVGRTIDPANVGDVKAYFDKLSAQKPPVPTEQIQREFGDYVRNNYTHPGGVDWGATPPPGERGDPAKLTRMIEGQPRDFSGRAALDCEGHTYLTAAVFAKNPRFDVVFADGGSHVSAVVLEKSSNKGFGVNTMAPPEIVTPAVASNEAMWKKSGWSQAKQHEMIAKLMHNGENTGNGRPTRDVATPDEQRVD